MAASGAPIKHHVHTIAIVRQTTGADATIVAFAEDLTEFNYFTRGSFRQGIMFGITTVGTRVPPGITRVMHEGFLCQNYFLSSGMGVMVVTTDAYPARVAVSLAQQLTEQFDREIGASAWRAAAENSFNSWAPLVEAITKFQNPAEADTLLRVRAKLDATKESLCSTIDDLLKRGETLEKLVDESKQMSDTSKKFYREARKADSCCVVM